MLSAKVIQELRAELETLEAHRKKVEDERVALTRVVDRLDQEIFSITTLLDAHGKGEPGLKPEVAMPDASEDKQEPVGIRAAIRNVLSDAGTGLRPAQVTRRLKAAGFKTSGKAELGTRVSNEMWRMAKNKLLIRSRGKYTLINNLEKIAEIKIVS